MIPIQLTIEGLYSYQNRQTIDFNQLIEAGLFGIFGAVGSGKSSILEAITFALYGNSDRLGATNFAYNMMNLKSNKLYIEFEFYNFENKRFKIVREYRRNGKNFDKIVNSGAFLYEFINEDWLPLNHLDTEKVIGLSTENFRRTIIIPQGKFKEFIELKSTARTQMMKEIFNLHRFDLQDKVAVLAKKNQSEIDQLEGKLSGFEEVSEEHITELQTQFGTKKEQVNQIQQEYNAVNEKFQQLKVLKSDFESLKQKQISFEELSTKKVEMDQCEAELIRYELIFNAFNQLLIQQNSLQKEIQSKNSSIQSQQKQFVLIENQIKEIKNQIESIQAYYEALPTKRKEENDLELMVQILNFTKEIEELKNRTKNGLEEVEAVKKIQFSIENEIKTEEINLKQLAENKIDAQVLLAVGNWFNQTESIKKSIESIQNKIADKKLQIETYHQKLIDHKISIETFIQDFNEKNNALEANKIELDKKRNDLLVQQKLAHFAHNLHKGENCPLCGSLEHPKVLKADDVTNEINSILKEINQLNEAQKELVNSQNEIQQSINQKQFIETQLANDFNELKQKEIELVAHQELFNWADFDANNYALFLEKKNKAAEIETAITAINHKLSSHRNLLEEERKKAEKYQTKLEEFKVKEAEKASQIKQNISNLKVLRFEDFETFSIEKIQQQWIDLKSENAKIEEQYQILTQQLNEIQLKLEAQKSSISLLTSQVKVHQADLIILDEAILQKLKENKFASIEEVNQILAQTINVQEIRKNIEDFKIAYETLKQSINELEQKLAKVSFDEVLYQMTEEELQLTTQQLKAANDVIAKLEAEIARLQKAFEAKKELLKTFEQVQKRATNLKTIQAMFYKAGFVNYVSSIYLKQLCDNANVRFHRMTKNQLSLQLNEDNDFEIIDYLNEGRSRSVKTLSGGQAFQVSLSLALALAESVQASSKANRNFFFIDEGFGTQDADAVNIVFETLNNLHKENRIVGIISHVEELKERIPMALNIVKDEENGSEILIN